MENSEVAKEKRIKLEQAADQALKKPETCQPNLRCKLRQIRLSQCPSFGDDRSWSVLAASMRAGEGAPLLIREITWHRQGDLRQFNNPMEWLRRHDDHDPTLTVRDGLVSAAAFHNKMAELESISIPVLPDEDVFGLDGETFELELGLNSLSSVCVEWWCEGPVEWKGLTSWFEAVLNLLQDSLNKGAEVPSLYYAPKPRTADESSFVD